MKFVQPAETTGSATRSVAVCLSSENGGRFDLRETPRSSPAAGEIEVAVEAASVNPIDVRRAGGYGRRMMIGDCSRAYAKVPLATPQRSIR